MPTVLSRPCKRFALLGGLLAIPLLASGQNAFSPGGPDYAIAGALAGDQTSPRAAIVTNGGWLVWQDNAVDGAGLGIRAQRLNANLVRSGAAVRVNAQTAGDQEKPRVALLNNGGAVFAWQGGTYGFQKIYVRFVAANGSFITSDIRANTYTDQFQVHPGVATLADGTVVVIWSSYGQDGSYQGVYGQRFSATGVKSGGEFLVNQATLSNQRTPAVAALAGGDFVVVWVSELQRTSASVDIYARIFNSSGTALGDEFPVNLSTSNVCANPEIAGSPQGGFAVVWSQQDTVTHGLAGQFAGSTVSSNGWDVFGRLFNANGSPATGPVRLNTETYGDQFAPRVSAFGNNYLTVWTSLGHDGSGEGVFGQFLTSGGGLEGVEFRINTTTVSRQIEPAVSADGINRFLVVWSSFVAGTSFDLFARSYDLIHVEIVPTAQGVNVSWNTQPGSVYQVQSSANLSAWSNVGSPRTAAGYQDSITVSAAGGAASYRVLRVQ